MHEIAALTGVRPAPAAADRRIEAERAAASFEQIFVQQMVRAMRDSVSADGGEGLFGKGPEAGTYEDWFDQHLGRHLTERGGIGIAEVLLRDWERYGLIEPAPALTAAEGERDDHA